MKKIVLVEDDVKYSQMVKDILESEHYEVKVYNDPIDAYDALKHQNYDLVITDLMMKEVDGFQLVQLVNRLNMQIPIIILTGNEDDESEVKGLNLHVSDYIRKPFNVDIFLARVNNAFTFKHINTQQNIIYDPTENLKVDLKQRTVFKGDEEIRLTKKEFDLLVLFLNNKNIVLTRDEIVSKVWTDDIRYMDTRTIDVHIKNLRLKLKVYAIQTIYGIGYKWHE